MDETVAETIPSQTSFGLRPNILERGTPLLARKQSKCSCMLNPALDW